MPSQIYKRFLWPGVFLLTVLAIGAIGYWLVGGRQNSFIDVIYMTFITITTIGFGEIIDMSSNPAGRAFTMLVAISGMGVLVHFVTNLTALVVEGELTQSFRSRKMEKLAKHSNDHYIVCGTGEVGYYIIRELYATKRPHVIVDANRENIDKISGEFKDAILLEGNATDDDTLLKAGIKKAKGIFAVTGDDNHNLVVSLTAKQLNPNVRVVAQCDDIRNNEKMKKAGADAVVSPCFIGGLRMASEMIRPTVVSFLDIMLRDKEKNLRVEEVPVHESYVGKTISDLNLKKYPHILLLAIKTKGDWIYNPPADYTIQAENILVFMATPEGRGELEHISRADI